MKIQHIPYTPRPVYEQHLFPRGTMDAEATIDTMEHLQRLLDREYVEVVSPLGRAILESAIYHLRTQLREYLTRGK